MKYILFVPFLAITTLSLAQSTDIEGTIKATGIHLPTDAQDGHLLTSDSFGNASWQPLLDTTLRPDLALSITSVLPIGTLPRSVAVQGSYAYVVDGNSVDLKIINVTDPANPSISGSLMIGNSPVSVTVQGSYAYVVDAGSDDLKIIDVSDPTNPSLEGSLMIGNSPVSVTVQGSYTYVVDDDSHDLKIIDVSDPSNPSLADSLVIGPTPRSIAVQGGYAYVVDNGSVDLKIIDVTDPANPSISGSLMIGNSPVSVTVQGSYAYVVDAGSVDLKIIDVSAPTNPSFEGSLMLGTLPRSVAVQGNFAYVVDSGSNDLKVIDVSDPANPFLSAFVGIGDIPRSIALQGNFAYIVDIASNDLKVIQLSEEGFLGVTTDGELETRSELDPQVGKNTTNFLSKWDGSALVQSSSVYEDGAGNVGIGTTNPQHPLDLGPLSGKKLAVLQSDIDFYGFGIGDGTLELHAGAQGNEDATMVITFNGNVGIGTTNPLAKLHVDGSIRFEDLGSMGGMLQTDSDGNLSVSSDIRLKDLNGTFSKGLDAILKLDPILYKWNEKSGLEREHTYAGFSAQNVQAAIPEAVGADRRGYLTLSDRPIIAALVNAVKELKTENERLNKRESEMQSRLSKLEAVLSEFMELKRE